MITYLDPCDPYKVTPMDKLELDSTRDWCTAGAKAEHNDTEETKTIEDCRNFILLECLNFELCEPVDVLCNVSDAV